MPTKPKSHKRAKRTNWKQMYEHVARLLRNVQADRDDWRNKAEQRWRLWHDDSESLREKLEATERHNAELLREVEELRTKRFEIVGPNGEPYVPQAGDMLVGYRPGVIGIKRQPRLFGNRFRALLSTFSRKGMSAAE